MTFDEYPMSSKRKTVLKEQNFKCLECGIGNIYNGKTLKLELDHINGDNKNNSRNNLRFLCPNCHSQTDTYKGKNNKNIGLQTYSDQDIITALQSSISIYSAIRMLGMSSHGNHYKRIRNIIEKYNINLPYDT